MIKEIFRAGKWTSSNGTTKTYTEADLDKIIAQFNNGKEGEAGKTKDGRKVPLTVGHPDDNAPAFGYLGKIWRDGIKLMGGFVNVLDVMKGWISQKTYEAVSIAINGDLSLRHVGILGGVPPAVPSMGDWKFMDGDQEVVIPGFAFEKDENFESLTFSSEENMNELEQALNKNAELSVENKTLADNNKAMATELEASKAKVEELTGKVGETEIALKDAESKFTEKEKEFNELTEANAQAELKRADEADVAFAEKVIAEHKALPRDKEVILATMKSLRNSEEMEFSDGDKKVKKTPLTAYKESLENANEIIESGETFTEGVEKTSAKETKLSKLVDEYAAEKEVDINTATAAVLELHPELNKGDE